MLRITIELVPGGREDGRRELARAELSNMTDLAVKSDYRIAAYELDNTTAAMSAWTANGMICDHYRRQTVWSLVAKAATWAAKEAEKRA